MNAAPASQPSDQIAREARWSGLMMAAQDGDSRAYAQLLTEIAPFIRNLARRERHAPDRLEDVVQDVLITLHRIRDSYEPGRPFIHWLATITHRRSIDLLRKTIRQGRHEVFDEESYETFADPGATKEQEAYGDASGLAAALAYLSPSQREAIELIKLQELSLSEASERTGKSVAALKITVHRAVKLLRDKLVKK